MDFLPLLPVVVLMFFARAKLRLNCIISCVRAVWAFWVCHITFYWAGPCCPLHLFYWILLGNLVGPYFILTLWGLSRLILLFKKGHSTMSTSYALPFSLKRAHRPTVVLIFYFQFIPFLLRSLLGPCIFNSSPFWALRLQLNRRFFTHSLSYSLGQFGLFPSLGL